MHTADNAQATAGTTTTDENTVELDFPLKRGDTELHSVHLRKPVAGELRGIRLTELLNLDVAAVQQILPRVTTPTMTSQEVANLDPADFTELATKVASFFVRKSVREAYLTA